MPYEDSDDSETFIRPVRIVRGGTVKAIPKNNDFLCEFACSISGRGHDGQVVLRNCFVFHFSFSFLAFVEAEPKKEKRPVQIAGTNQSAGPLKVPTIWTGEMELATHRWRKVGDGREV